MEKLHSNYVFVRADKAANNVVIIRKRYYVDVVKEELSSTSTYICTCSPDERQASFCILHHIDTLTKINVKIDNFELPTFYGLPKLHKFLINHASCQILVSALLLLFQSILHPI